MKSFFIVFLLLFATFVHAGEIRMAPGPGIEQVFSIRDYGAVSNGTTDDRAAVQAALDAAYSAGGGKVVIPCGKITYIDSTIYIDDNTTLTSCPSGGTLKRSNTNTLGHPDYNESCTQTGNESGNEMIRNRKKDCSGANIVIENIIFDNVAVDPGAETGVGPTKVSVAIVLSGVDGLRFRNNTFVGCPQDCLFVKGGGTRQTIIENNRFLGCLLKWGNGACINIEVHSNGSHVGPPTIRGNYIDSTGPTFCDGDGAKTCDEDADCTGETPATCSSPGTGTRVPFGIQVMWVTGSSQIVGVKITDNMILASDRHIAISCFGCRNSEVSGNVIQGTTTATLLSGIFNGIQILGANTREPKDIKVLNNEIVGVSVANDLRCILADGVDADGTGLLVSGNTCKNKSVASGLVGIEVRNWTGYKILNNYIDTIAGGYAILAGVNSGATIDGVISGNNVLNVTGANARCIAIKGTTRLQIAENTCTTATTGIEEVSGSPTGTMIGYNEITSVTTPITLASGAAAYLFGPRVTFAKLPANAGDGSIVQCTDCNSTCAAGSSSGKWCQRVSGAWAAAY